MASSELLKQIQAGKRLKKAETHDRSAPIIDTPKGSGGSSGVGGSSLSVSSLASGGGPPQLAGLFAGGMPKLKPAGQTKLGIPPTLGKPPSIPKSDGSPAPTPPARNVPPPKPPAPVPARPSVPPPRLPTQGSTLAMCPAPSLPSRRNYMGASSAPLPPRRAPPAIRSESPPVSPPPPQTRSPVKPASPISRSIPAVPIQNSSPVASPTKQMVDRAPPPPPPTPRPSHVVALSPARTAPPPPARRPPPAAFLASSIDPAPRIQPQVPDRPPSSNVSPPSRRPTVASTNGVRPVPPRRKIPSPSPNSGAHTFPVTDFPPPRDFKTIRKLYNSGSQQGSNFDLGNL